MIDHVCIAGDLSGRVAEYVDHLHEHFTEPVVVAGGRYQAPVQPGIGAEMLRPSVERWTFSSGAGWQDVLAR
jgi:L-fuconate dehydratase